MIVAIGTLQEQGVPVRYACQAFDVPPSSYYCHRRAACQKRTGASARTRLIPARALSAAERSTIHAVLVSERFVDKTPRQVYASLLDEGIYLGSVSTFYRILHEYDEVKERRNQRQHPARVKPQLLTTAPNQLWSWDITKLHSPHKYAYFYLYVILDVYSRYVVGWMLAEQESAELAQQLISQSCDKQGVGRNQLTLHADNGGPMVALTTAQLLETLGVHKTHSRSYTPNDNAYSEAHFKTMKYRPDFPARFETLEDARGWAGAFFQWYNHEHYHSALTLLTPATVHHGQTTTVLEQRNAILHQAYERHPNRFVRGLPQHPTPPGEVWINRPSCLPITEGGGTSGAQK